MKVTRTRTTNGHDFGFFFETYGDILDFNEWMDANQITTAPKQTNINDLELLKNRTDRVKTHAPYVLHTDCDRSLALANDRWGSLIA